MGAEVLRMRQVAEATRDYLRSWVGYARARVKHAAERLEAAFWRIKERFQEQGLWRAREGGRGAEPGQPGATQSFLARRERLAPQEPAPEAQRGSFWERRASAASQERSMAGPGPFPERARDASRDHATLTPGADDAQGRAGESSSGAHAVRKADAMETAKAHMAQSLSRLTAYLPEGPAKEELERRARSLLDRAEEATKAQRRAEQAAGAERPEPAKEPSEAERQRRVDLENRKRLLREERQRDRSEGQER